MDSQPGRSPMPGKPSADPRVNVYIDGYNFYVPLSGMDRSRYELSWCDFLSLARVLTKRLAAEHPTEFGTCALGAVKYFTATIPENMPKDRSGIERKYSWLDALHYHTAGKVEVIHGTFRARRHRFYIERDELENLARCGIAVDWKLVNPASATFHPTLRIHEEKQTDVMLACSLVTDAALGRSGSPAPLSVQAAPHHRSNTRPHPAPCHAAIVISADIDFLPAAEMTISVFSCPVAMAFTFPHTGYDLGEMAHGRRHPHLFTIEVAEAELRRCMLPPEVPLPDGRRIQFEKIKRSHFNRVKATGG
ncbi:MAG: hypothetical protein KIT09_34035 [Bryobacteraceae bacterium]|nr:hypothetical protein [Bryobacteraceae bacterium]